MSDKVLLDLGRRERQIMEVVYASGKASVSDVLEALPDPPSYSAVRAMLNLLEEKGHLRHKEVGRKFVYMPTVPRTKARRSAIRKLVHTFFGGSCGDAAASLIELEREKLSAEDLDRLAALIEKARKEGR
ncbi:MAG: BlaI/MecI/CopY family transcriptional regulator [Gemmatimonadetes bacterium]|nr:BlaI/MecI/CopY family transcriptional regulator [Gemmatimonadota bacterium]